MVIGVTGFYAAGKDVVSRLLSERGFTEINVDAVGHRALEEMKSAVAGEFGNGVLAVDGSVDRRVLGRIVFGNRKKLARLEALLHPRMRKIVSQILRDGPDRDFVINAAVLFPMGLAGLADLVMIVRAPCRTRYRRARARDGLSLAAFIARCRSQVKIAPKPRPKSVDIYDVWNTRDLTYLTQRINAIMLRHATDVKKGEKA